MPIYFHIQNATFQLLLASDGLTTYTGFLYKAMHFLPPKKAVMGYRCGKSARSIFNLPGSLTSSIYSEVINNGDNGIILLPPSLFINNTCIYATAKNGDDLAALLHVCCITDFLDSFKIIL